MNSSKQGKNNHGGKRRLRADLLAAALLLGIAIFAATALVRYISYQRIDMVRVAKSSVEATLGCEIAVLRNETLVYAPADGDFQPAAAAGSKVKAGGLLGFMSTSQKDGLAGNDRPVYAPQGGIVYYDLDGWEGILNTEEPLARDWEEVFSQLRNGPAIPALAAEGGLENQGQGRRIARLVDNLAANLICIAVCGDLSPYVQDDSIKIRLTRSHTAKTLRVDLDDSLTIAGDTHYLIAAIGHDETYFYDFRYLSAAIIGDQISGMEIPLSALTENEAGETAVLVSKSKKLVFRQVTVLYRGEDIALVEGLQTTDQVASRPQYAKPGQKIY
ncbi:MAG: hypothetical protein GX572_02065 [Clostridia bacterium]|nr:hypothetical protein [Clostridia bacterium]